jgi:hypothetical protein
MSDFVGADGDAGFPNYDEKSKDPGPVVLIATIIFCFLSLAVLPCVMCLRNKCAHRRRESGASVDSVHSNDNAAQGLDIASLSKRKGQSEPDSASVASDNSSTSSVRLFFNAVLDGNPRSGSGLARNRVDIGKRQQQLEMESPSMSPLANILSLGKQEHAKHGSDEDNSASSASAMSRLDQDEVSIRDAVDADSTCLRAADPTDHKKGDELPFWKPAAWARAFDALLEIAEADVEMKRIIRLGTPFVAKAMAEGILETVNVAIVGKHIGTPEVAAYVTVDMLVGLSASVLSGFDSSLITLCSQAVGVGNKQLAGTYLQITLFMYVTFFAPLIIFWILYMKQTLQWFQFNEEIVGHGVGFTRIYVFVALVKAVSHAIHSLLDTIDKEAYSSTFTIIEHLFSTVAVLIVALGDNPNLEKVGLGLLFVAASGMFINVLIILWKGWFDPFLGGIVGSFGLRVCTDYGYQGML